MIDSRNRSFNRRDFLSASTLMGAVALLGLPRPAAAEPSPETSKIRLVLNPGICLAPQHLAEELLRLEGFSQIEYVPHTAEDSAPHMVVAAGRADITMDAATVLVPALDAGRPVVVLGGVHGGCYELFGNERVRAIRDLMGKSIAIWEFGAHDHVYIASMLAYVGIDPRKDVNWVVAGKFDGPMELFIDGKVDIPRISPSAAEGSSAKSWPRNRQHGPGQTLVPAFLLHGRRAPGLCAQEPRRDKTNRSCFSQGRRHLCPRAGTSRPIHGEQGLRSQL